MSDGLKLKVDLTGLSDKLRQKFATLANPEYLLRPVAFDLVALMTQRIHDKGLASDETPIGVYSNPYLKLRQDKFKRTADAKVVISLTRQLENDWSVVEVKGGYGIGFKNQFNRDKSKWVESNYSKEIFSLSAPERSYAAKRFNELVSEQLNS